MLSLDSCFKVKPTSVLFFLLVACLTVIIWIYYWTFGLVSYGVNQRHFLSSNSVLPVNTNWLVVVNAYDEGNMLCDWVDKNWTLIALADHNILLLKCEENQINKVILQTDSGDTIQSIVELAIGAHCKKLCFLQTWMQLNTTGACYHTQQNNYWQRNTLFYDKSDNLCDTVQFPLHYHFGCDNLNNHENVPNPKDYKYCHLVKTPLETSFHPHNGRCNEMLPPVALARNHFIIIPFYGTAVTLQQFWVVKMLYLLEDTSIKRNITEILMINGIVHKALWMSNSNVKYHYSQERVFSNRHFFGNLNFTDHIMRAISSLKCHLKEKGLLQCIHEWMNVTIPEGSRIKSYVNNWLERLEQANYGSYLREINTTGKVQECELVKQVLYTPVKANTERSFPYKKDVTLLYNNTCSNPQHVINFNNQNLIFNGIILVVIFNTNLYQTVHYNELLYAPFFSHIIYCGPESPNVGEHPYLFDKSSRLRRTFVFHPPIKGDDVGSYFYVCASTVLKLAFKATGYMFCADDALLNVRKVSGFDRSMFWFNEGLVIVDLASLEAPKFLSPKTHKEIQHSWHHWSKYTNRTWNVMKTLYDENKQNPSYKKCSDQMFKVTGGKFRFWTRSVSDFFYIPSQYAADICELFDLFLREWVYMEIAVPASIVCLAGKSYVAIDMKRLWDPVQRLYPWSFLTPADILKHDVTHPVKWSLLTRKFNGTDSKHVLGARDFLCNEVLPYFHGLK